MLVYDTEDGNVRCTSCNICAKVCPPQCIWMTQAKGPKGNVMPLPEDFYIDMDVCMNCGLCSEYCPFDAIKMDQNFELSNYERHQTHIYSLRGIADDFETLRQVLEFNWHAHGALDDPVTRDDQPQQRRDADGQELQADVAKRGVHHQLSAE